MSRKLRRVSRYLNPPETPRPGVAVGDTQHGADVNRPAVASPHETQSPAFRRIRKHLNAVDTQPQESTLMDHQYLDLAEVCEIANIHKDTFKRRYKTRIDASKSFRSFRVHRDKLGDLLAKIGVAHV